LKILIVDDENDVAEIMSFLIQDLTLVSVETIVRNNGTEAIKELDSNEFDYCICDHNMPNGSGDKVLQHIVLNKIKTKFILCSTVTPSTHPDLYPKNKIFFNIEKPDVVNGIEKLVNIIKEENPVHEPSTSSKFHPIPVHYLNLFEQIPVDIFIKLSESKYVKCYKKGDSFTGLDETKLKDKSVTRLFIESSSDKVGTNEIIQAAIINIFKKKEVSLEERLSNNYYQLTNMIKFMGMTPELSKTIKTSIQESTKYILESNVLKDSWKKLNLKGNFPAKLYTLQCFICGAILKRQSWNSEPSLLKLTMASLLQDLSIEEIELMELYDFDEFKKIQPTLSASLVKNYLDHPLKAKELANQIPDLPLDIEKILLDQHETPLGSGFPKGISASQLSPLSCLFIISGFTARYMLRNEANFSMYSLLGELDKRGFKNGNFREPFEVIQSFL
jgi:CheY-like chemotaxis protein